MTATREEMVFGKSRTPELVKERKERAKRIRAEKEARPKSYLWEVYHSSCEDMIDKLAPDSVDWIITDPPYAQKYLSCYNELGALAGRVLKPGGGMLVMTGHKTQYVVYEMMQKYNMLRYHWTVAYVMEGGTIGMPYHKIGNIGWKPIMMYSKGKYTGSAISDVVVSPRQQKQDYSLHPAWQQSAAGFQNLLDKFAFPSDVVLDPFNGGGTTGVAALNRGCTYIGSDIDAELVHKSRLRLANLPVMLTASGMEASGAGS